MIFNPAHPRAGSQVTTGDLIGIRAFRDASKRKASLVRGVVLHSGKSRPLDADDIALPWIDGACTAITCGLLQLASLGW